MTSRILVADDSPTIQKIVALAFEDEDMEVKGVANGHDAWGMLADFNPDIVMADVELPGMSGFELSRKIKSSTAHQKRWVILLSSDFEEFDEQAFEACAAEDHLSKPFKSEDIVSKVQQMLSGEGIPNTLEIVAEEPSSINADPLSLSADDLEDANDGAPTTVALSAEDMENPDEEETIGLSADDLIDELLEDAPVIEDSTPEEEPEPVMELSAEDLTPEEDDESLVEPVSLSEEDLTEQAELQTEPDAEPETEPAPESDNETEEESAYSYLLTDDRMTDFDESRMPPDSTTASNPEPEVVDTMATETDNAEPVETRQEEQQVEDTASPDFFLGEPRRDPDPAEDLENAFRSVSNDSRVTTPHTPTVEPESANTDSTPDLIRESQAFLAGQTGIPAPSATQKKPAPAPGFSQEHMTEAMVQHAARVLEAGLDRNLKKELSGISEQINKVVRDVVQEMAPDIIRDVIRQEIQEIRKSQQN